MTVKLTFDQRQDLKKRSDLGHSRTQLSRDFGISYTQVSRLLGNAPTTTPLEEVVGLLVVLTTRLETIEKRLDKMGERLETVTTAVTNLEAATDDLPRIIARTVRSVIDDR